MEVSNYRTFVGYLMEVLYIYNPQNETLMTVHEEEVQDLYQRFTIEIPGIKAGRAIGLESFTVAVKSMMEKAYKEGQMEGFSKAENIVEEVFNAR